MNNPFLIYTEKDYLFYGKIYKAKAKDRVHRR